MSWSDLQLTGHCRTKLTGYTNTHHSTHNTHMCAQTKPWHKICDNVLIQRCVILIGFYEKTNTHTHTHTPEEWTPGSSNQVWQYTRAELAEYSPLCTSYYLWNKVLHTHIKSMAMFALSPVLLWPIALKPPVLPSQRKPPIPCQFPTEQSPSYEQFLDFIQRSILPHPQNILFICCRE